MGPAARSCRGGWHFRRPRAVARVTPRCRRVGPAARAHAWLRGSGYVTPDDVRRIAPDVLRHRVIPSFEADAEGVTSETIVARLLAVVPAP